MAPLQTRANERVNAARNATVPNVRGEEVSSAIRAERPTSTPNEIQGGAAPAPEVSSGGGVLEQMASADMGSLAAAPQAQESQQVETPLQAQQEQQAAQAQRVSGMTPAAATMSRGQEIDRRIPVVELPSQMPGIESTRRQRFNPDVMGYIHDSLATSGMEASLANTMQGDDLGSRFYDPTPTPEMLDMRDRLRARQVRQDLRQEVVPEAEKAADVTRQSKPTQQVTGQPDNIYNRPAGWNGKSRAPRMRQPSVKRPKNIVKKIKNAAKRMFGSSGRGYKIYTKALGLSTGLDFRDIGIGMRELLAVLEQNPEMLEKLVYRYTQQPMPTDINELVELINNSDMYVATFKPPNNRGQDFQRRRLRVLTIQQRGIFMHPIMAAMYTADFDGDDMQVTLDPDVARYTKDPMEHMVGIDGKISLNTDFLPVSNIVDGYEDGKTRRDYVREQMLGWLSRQNANGDTVRPFVDTVLALSDVADNEDEQEDAWAKVFIEARRLSDRLSVRRDGSSASPEYSNALMSRLIRSVYSGMQLLRAEGIYKVADEHKPEHFAVAPVTHDDRQLYEVLDGMVDGVVPGNFQEFKVLMNGFLGNVEGKNAPFRFSADVGKMMKMDSRFKIGDEYVVDMNDESKAKSFFESTCKYAESNIMMKEIKKEGRSDAYTQILRMRVIAEVGFYGDLKKDGKPRYDSYASFLREFVRSYHFHSAVINESNLVTLSDMSVSSNSNRGAVGQMKFSKNGMATLSDIADPMRNIYGSYSIERLFDVLVNEKIMGPYVDDLWYGNPNMRVGEKKSMYHSVEREYERTSDKFWITNRYASWSLNRFIHENRLLPGQKTSGISVVRDSTVRDLEKMTDAEAQFYMLRALADKRTSTASKFNEKNYGKVSEKNKSTNYDGTTVKMMSDAVVDLDRLSKMGDRKDQMLWINDIVEMLTMSGSDMFTYFGMDNADGFRLSKWARKMIEHKNDMEVLGGIRTAMVFDYRMERVEALAQLPDPDVDLERFAVEYNNWELARDELANASEVWHGIMSEFMAEDTRNQKSVFQIMRENSGKPVSQRLSKYGQQWLKDYDAAKFWARMDDKYQTLRDVITDLDLDRETKWNVIADVVRYWENDAYLNSWEVGFQLEIGNDSSYSLESSGGQGALKTHQEFEQAFNRWGKTNQETLQKEISEASKKYRRRQGYLTRTLQRLDASPWELISISDETYADALMAVKDKSYAQTEKGQQHPWSNSIYSALSYQRNGGYANDIYRTDDRLLGLRSIESISARDIIHILANPDEEIWVYNEYGEVQVVTRDIMLESYLGRDLSDGVSEGDIWDFLEANPRVAAAIRQHCACVKTDTNGGAYLGSVLSISETIQNSIDKPIDIVGNVKYLLRDDPTYAALISMCTRSLRKATKDKVTGEKVVRRVGSVTRNERRRVMETEDYIAKRLYMLASSDASDKEIAKEFLRELGVGEDASTLAKILRPDYDVFLKELGLPMVKDSEAESDAEQIYTNASDGIVRFLDKIRKGAELGRRVDGVVRPRTLGVDVVSIASYWDVTQELSGAKTAVSTGIEGSETYNFAEWSSHISANDRYADFEVVSDDIDQSWNGAWTNLMGEDGVPARLSVGEDGQASVTLNGRTYVGDEIITEAKKECGEDEVVIRVPDGYTVKDRSTDSHGTQVNSLFAYMVSKRSNGAEAFNLKAKKSGIDGYNSIVKMDGMDLVDEDEDGNRRRRNYSDLRYELQWIVDHYGEDGLDLARLQLAYKLLEENQKLGYKDLTLANYTCIADLMIQVSDDGQVQLRSLEMLYSAIKNRIGSSVDEMNETQLHEAADAIVRDTSDNGVGFVGPGAGMLTEDAFSDYRPSTKASSVNGVRLNSSVFERNYDLMQQIAGSVEEQPISPAQAERIDAKARNLNGIKDVMKRLRYNFTKGYNIVGFDGAKGQQSYIRWSVGPSNAIIIGDGNVDANMVTEICDNAYKHGMIVIVSKEHLDLIPSGYRYDAVPCSDEGDALIPCFDMRLNGSESGPYNGGRFAIGVVPPSRYVVSVEDSVNEFELGDAQVIATKAFRDRIKVVENGSKRVDAESLFPNVFRNSDYARSDVRISFASGKDVGQRIATGVKCTVDYGIVEGGRGFEQRRHDVDRAIERYRERWSQANPDGFMIGDMLECEPGDIVAWAQAEITDPITRDVSYVLAPIIPFPLHGPKKNVPERFSVQQVVGVGNDNTTFSVDWTNTSDPSFAKYFDSSGGANKGMVSFEGSIEEDRLLVDGTPIDIYIAKPSTNSRKVGTDRRIKTMISLMTKARLDGYNFARDYGKADGEQVGTMAFPNNPKLRQRLVSERVSKAEWRQLLADDVVFCMDPSMNAFLRYECKKIYDDGGNPSDYLANVFTDADGNERYTNVMWEFEAMFDQGINYENQLLRFLHSMMPGFCPDGIDDMREDYLFRLYRDEKGESLGYERGVVQMRVPHRRANGSTSWVWDNVSIGMSFFGEDYSGFSRPNIDGSSNFMDAMNTASHYGNELDARDARVRATWATSGFGRRPRDGGAIGTPDPSDMEAVRTQANEPGQSTQAAPQSADVMQAHAESNLRRAFSAPDIRTFDSYSPRNLGGTLEESKKAYGDAFNGLNNEISEIYDRLNEYAKEALGNQDDEPPISLDELYDIFVDLADKYNRLYILDKHEFKDAIKELNYNWYQTLILLNFSDKLNPPWNYLLKKKAPANNPSTSSPNVQPTPAQIADALGPDFSVPDNATQTTERDAIKETIDNRQTQPAEFDYQKQERIFEEINKKLVDYVDSHKNAGMSAFDGLSKIFKEFVEADPDIVKNGGNTEDYLEGYSYIWLECIDDLGLVPRNWTELQEFVSDEYDGEFGAVTSDYFFLPDRLLPPWGRFDESAFGRRQVSRDPNEIYNEFLKRNGLFYDDDY